MKFARKADSNQPEIVKGLRKVGAKVQHIHTIGKGCPDILVAYQNRWFVAEVKDGNKPPSAQQLTPDEKEWHEDFSQAAPVHIWRNLDEALATIGAITTN